MNNQPCNCLFCDSNHNENYPESIVQNTQLPKPQTEQNINKEKDKQREIYDFHQAWLMSCVSGG